MSESEPANPLKIAFTHRCPRCQQVSMYSGLLDIKDQCPNCGLVLAEHDVGDGPAFFAITILSFLVVGVALAVEVLIRPSYWVHGAVVIGLIALLTPPLLRFFKSYLIALKYKVHWSQEET